MPTLLFKEDTPDGFSDIGNWTRTGTPSFIPDLWNTSTTPAIDANGTTDDVLHISVVTSGNTFSVAIWVYLTAFDSGVMASDYTNSGGGNRIWQFVTFSDGSVYLQGSSGMTDTFTSRSNASLIPLNQWVHVMGTMTGNSDCSLYINGVEVSGYLTKDSQQGGGYVGPTASSGIAVANYSSGNPLFLDGSLTRFAIWDDQLTDAEVLAEYQSELALLNDGTGRIIPSPIISSIYPENVLNRGLYKQ